MEKKDHDFVDSELKKAKIGDFKYIGNRKGTDNIFVYEKPFGEDDKMCVVLNGKDDKKVEIEAETSYKSGADEYIDKIASFGSWKEAIEYLKRNTAKIVGEVEDKYTYHQKVKAKTARIAKRICASDCVSEVKAFIGELAEFESKRLGLVGKFKNLRESMWTVANGDDTDEQKKLLAELDGEGAKLLDGFEHFGLVPFTNCLKISISEKEPVSYKGFVIKVKRVSTYYIGYSIHKDGRMIYESNGGGFERYEDAVQYAKRRIDEYFSKGDDKKALDVMNALGISDAYYDVLAYEYKSDPNPQKTRHVLRDSDHALGDLVAMMEKNGVSDASQIHVVKKDPSEYYVFDRYDSASYEVYKGWKIVLKIGNDTWEWGVR